MMVRTMVVLPRLLSLLNLLTVILLYFPSANALSSSIEQTLAKNAIPLKPVDIYSAAAQLKDVGVCRINGILSETMCHPLRDRILSMRQGPMEDMRNIVGTRLRFDEPMMVPLNERTDILLPIEDSSINKVLTALMGKLGGVLEEGAGVLPGSIAEETFQELELVEVGCLVSRPGATHQSLHADFRRDANNTDARLPPRLVVFLYLQDVPTAAHGPTIFLPGTNNKESHQSHHTKKDLDLESTVNCATLNCGDVAIYDASSLHFGSSNSVPENIRAVMYFGVALKGAAALCASGGGSVLENLKPVSVMTGVDGMRYLSHESIKGMARPCQARDLA